MSDDDFFVGFDPKPPAADRRFVLGMGVAGLLGAGGLGFALAQQQQSAGPGSWNQGAVISEYRGLVGADPFPMLRTRDLDGTPRTAFLSCMTKCAVRDRLNSFQGGAALVRGSLISRGGHAMIAVADGPDWIEAAPDTPTDDLDFGAPTVLGDIDLTGEILDTKCWFGAMRPGAGKPHKACAALCIRHGLPPAFYVEDIARQSRLLVLTDADGAPHGPDLLPFVADPVRLRGTAMEHAGLVYLRAPLAGIARRS